MTTQEKISEAKKLLEQYAPKGEFLAYINRDEAKILKDLGGAGIVVEKTGIPSFWIQAVLTGLMVASTAMSFMGSMRRMQTLDTAAQWDKYNQKIKTSYNTIQANERARLALNLKRAYAGARGVQIGTDSPLIVQNSILDRLEDTVWWIEKGAEMDVRDIDLRLAGLLQEEAWKTGESLISGGLKIAELYR